MNNPTENSYINCDETLQHLYSAFGAAVFIPIPTGQFKPVSQDWEQTTFDQTQAASYLRKLSVSSIGVACGRASGQLCGIWFTSEEGLGRFIAENPGLKATVISETPIGFTVWLRIDGFYPRTQDLGTCMWQSDGTWVMVHNRYIFGPEFKIRGGPVVVKIPFAQLVLGSVADEAVRHQIVESLYGKPFASDERGRNRLNYSYWAYYFGSINCLKYHAGQKRFMRWKAEKSRWCLIHQETVMNELQQFLFRFGQASGLEILQSALPEKDLRMLLKNLKIVAVGDFAEEVDGLDAFLAERVERKRGCDVTSEEMFLAYGCFCQNHRLPALTNHEFTRKLPILVKEKFGITPGHSLIRDGRHRRGYHHLALKKLEAFGTSGTLRTHDKTTNKGNSQAKVL